MTPRLLITILAVCMVICSSCYRSAKNRAMTLTTKENFGTHQGKEVLLFTLTNKNGNVLKLSNLGARITWIEVPDRTGKKVNVTFGYDKPEDMISGNPFFGTVVGRYANRIAGGKFTLDGVEYSLTVNNGPNSLHGGPGGWHSLVWDGEMISESKVPAVRFTLESPHMQEGYPGNMKVEVVYSWTDDNEIILDYKCTTDKKTILNVTNHVYFNLHGSGNGDVLDHELLMHASRIVTIDSIMIPTGELREVKGTPFDFTTPRLIGERISDEDDQIKNANGYDHTFILDKGETVAAVLFDPVSGRQMEVITDLPGIQFYTGNFLNGTITGYGGKPYTFRSGLCLETGFYPDSPNHPEFPSTVLDAGETFKSRTIYRFSVK